MPTVIYIAQSILTIATGRKSFEMSDFALWNTKNPSLWRYLIKTISNITDNKNKKILCNIETIVWTCEERGMSCSSIILSDSMNEDIRTKGKTKSKFSLKNFTVCKK